MKERLGFIVSTLLAVILVAALSLQAEDKDAASANKIEKKSDRFAIQLSQVELKETTKTAKKLAHAIDLWHDANLKSDNGMIEKQEKYIYSIIDADIVSSRQKVARFEAQVNRSAGEAKGNSGTDVQNREDYRDFKNDVSNMKTSRELSKVKDKLSYSIKHSKSFSNKYRLLNDYLDLLSREAGINRVELAEDIQDWDEGK